MKLAPDTIADANECCALALHVAAEAQRMREALYGALDRVNTAKMVAEEVFIKHARELRSTATAIECRVGDVLCNIGAEEPEEGVE